MNNGLWKIPINSLITEYKMNTINPLFRFPLYSVFDPTKTGEQPLIAQAS